MRSYGEAALDRTVGKQISIPPSPGVLVQRQHEEEKATRVKKGKGYSMFGHIKNKRGT
jgi:hypothetical protein